MGIRVTGLSGVTQIDDNRKNPVLVASGSVQTVADVNPRRYESVYSRADINFPAGSMVAIRAAPTDGFTGIIRADYSAGYAHLVSDGPPGTQINWYAFGEPSVAASSGVRLNIRNAQGQLTYSLQHKPLVIVDWFTSGGLDGPTYSGGEQCAVLFGGYIGAWWWAPGPPPFGQEPSPDFFYYRLHGGILGMRATPSGVEFGPQEHSDTSTAGGEVRTEPGTNTFYPGTVLVVDVTGY